MSPVQQEMVFVENPQGTYKSFLERMLDGYMVTESVSTHPQVIVHGNHHIIKITLEPINPSTTARECKRITFEYGMPHEEELIKNKLIPLSYEYFRGNDGGFHE